MDLVEFSQQLGIVPTIPKALLWALGEQSWTKEMKSLPSQKQLPSEKRDRINKSDDHLCHRRNTKQDKRERESQVWWEKKQAPDYYLM